MLKIRERESKLQEDEEAMAVKDEKGRLPCPRQNGGLAL